MSSGGLGYDGVASVSSKTNCNAPKHMNGAMAYSECFPAGYGEMVGSTGLDSSAATGEGGRESLF